MDLDFDDQPSDHAAPAVRGAGARFKPKGRPQPKKKQVSLSTSQTTLPTDVAKEKSSTQSEDPVSLDGSSAIPTKASPSESIMSDSGIINQSTIGTLSEENVDVYSRGVHWSRETSVLHACNNMDLEGKRRDDGIEAESAFLDDPRTHDSTIFGDSVTPETDADIQAQTGRMQTGEDECRLDMETLNIIQEEGTTSAYVQHSGKFQPKPRLLDTVVEEPESHYSVDDNVYFSMGTNEPEFMANVESRNGFSTYGDIREEELNIPDASRESVPEMEVQNASGGWENNTGTGEAGNYMGDTLEEERSGKGTKRGKSKGATARKRKNTSEEAPNKSSEKPEKKKFKHSSRRQKRTLEKELLETPDDEIRFLPIRDMLRVVEYKEWMEKKEAKGAVVPPTQESSNMNASESQYYSQGFDAEDEFGMEEGENEETNVVKPDSPVNYQTYMNKTSRTRWSKQDTELFYEGIRDFGSNLSMIQQLFPNRTREQMKLKFKLEERRYPLKLNDALKSRSKNFTHFQNVIKKLQQEAAAAREAEGAEEEEAEEEAGAEAETTDVPENEEPEKSAETEQATDGVAGVKESDGGTIENGVRSDGGDECDDDDDDDDDFWNSYKSEM